jgi:hypothetical protein
MDVLMTQKAYYEKSIRVKEHEDTAISEFRDVIGKFSELFDIVSETFNKVD